MKKIFKNSILTFVLGAILFSGITAYAAGRYYATQVDYEPSNPNFNVDNMSDALDQLYTTQNTTISNLNNQVTTLTGQVSAKDATISDLQTQLNGISTTDCIRGTFTASSTCATSTGCLIEDKFNPTFLVMSQENVVNGQKCSIFFDKNVNSSNLFAACRNNDMGHDTISTFIRVNGNNVYLKNAWDNFQSGTVRYVACR
ncbi:MAG: hypothetical protein E7158_01415 [Firmicutes bacterium]|nr:hypothetical protein [Bacillota bacterium]